MVSSNASIQIFCAGPPSYGVTVATGSNLDVYLAEGYTTYGGSVDANGEPTDSNWCRVKAGAAPVNSGNPSGQAGGGFVDHPTGAVITTLPDTGGVSLMIPLILTIVAVAIYGVYRKIKGLYRRYMQRRSISNIRIG